MLNAGTVGFQWNLDLDHSLKLFGMFGAVDSCVRMSECTMNSRLFRWRFLSEPGVGLPKWIESLWLFSERMGGEGK